MRKISAITRHFEKSLNQCYLLSRKLSPTKKTMKLMKSLKLKKELQKFETLSFQILSETYRSISQEVFYKKGVLRNFTKSTGKHLC